MPNRIVIPSCFLHDDKPLPKHEDVFLASPAVSICSSEPPNPPPVAVDLPPLSDDTPPSDGNGTPTAMLLEQSVGQQSADSDSMRMMRQGSISKPKMARKSSLFVVDCQSEYTDVAMWECDNKGSYCRSEELRRLPSVRRVLESETETDLLDPLRELVGDTPMLVTSGSGLKTDMLEGSCDRMRFARLKRAIQNTVSAESDFVIMNKEEEVAAAWRAVQSCTPTADAVLYLGATVFGIASSKQVLCAEYHRQSGDASLLHHINRVDWEEHDGVTVLVESTVDMLRECCGLECGVPYSRDTVLGEVECAEPETEKHKLASAFLISALGKFVSSNGTVLLDPKASSLMGALATWSRMKKSLSTEAADRGRHP